MIESVVSRCMHIYNIRLIHYGSILNPVLGRLSISGNISIIWRSPSIKCAIQLVPARAAGVSDAPAGRNCGIERRIAGRAERLSKDQWHCFFRDFHGNR